LSRRDRRQSILFSRLPELPKTAAGIISKSGLWMSFTHAPLEGVYPEVAEFRESIIGVTYLM
jgi:hypothetical protein